MSSLSIFRWDHAICKRGESAVEAVLRSAGRRDKVKFSSHRSKYTGFEREHVIATTREGRVYEFEVLTDSCRFRLTRKPYAHAL